MSGPPPSDIVTTIHEEDGRTILKYEQDVEPVLEAIKRGETRPWLSSEKEFKAIAEIPVIVLAEWAKQQGMTWKQVMEDDNAMRRFMNDPDNSAWRIRDGGRKSWAAMPEQKEEIEDLGEYEEGLALLNMNLNKGDQRA